MPEQERQTSLRLHRGDWSSTDLEVVSRAEALHALRNMDWAEEWRGAKAASEADQPWQLPSIQIEDDAGYALFVRVLQDHRAAFHYEYPTRENRFGFYGKDDTASLNAAHAPPGVAEDAINLFFDSNEAELLQLLERYRVAEAAHWNNDEDDMQNE